MALAATTVWEVRTTGDPANAGGFDSAAAGTDRSQQDAAHVIIDGAAITCVVQATTTDVAITGYTTGAADVGNLVRITGGTMTAGTYAITAIPAAGQWRLDRSAGTAAQTGTGRMGGAQSDPALVAAVTVGVNRIWIKAGTYLITSATQNVAGGTISTPVGAQIWQGYDVARGDFTANHPILQASGINTATLFSLSQNDCKVINIDVDGQSLVAIRGIQATGRGLVLFCTVRNCTNSGIRSSSTNSLIAGCGVTGCSTAGAAFEDAGGGVAGSLYGCWARGNTVTGFSVAGYRLDRCIAASNTGATTDGFLLPTAGGVISDSIAYGNGRDGFRSVSTNEIRYINCVAEGNTGNGFNFTGGGVNQSLLHCAAFNNTAGAIGGSANLLYNINFVTGTASFFTNPGAGDFSVNQTVGGGASIRGVGLPATFIDGTTIDHDTLGAVQPESGGGGGGAGTGEGPELGGTFG